MIILKDVNLKKHNSFRVTLILLQMNFLFIAAGATAFGQNKTASRSEVIQELSSLSQEKLDSFFINLRAGSLPQGVYSIKTLNLEALKPSSVSRKFSDLFWSTRIFDRRQGVQVNRTVTGDRFPAPFYCMTGPSDYRRDAIVIDYRNVYSVPGFNEKLDWIAGALGLDLHEELRTIKPGFYLGKAWSGNFLLHYFVAYTDQIDGLVSGVQCHY